MPTDLLWLQFTGQSTAELLASAGTHRADSLLCAFESGIRAKFEAEGTESATDEEVLVLAIMALDREVNNGGYNQFFVNSSRRFVPVIVECLRRIGCAKTAEITERAIADRSEAARNACDQEYYGLTEIGPQLFRFIQAHQDRIRTGKPARILPVPRPRKPKATTKLWTQLVLSKESAADLDRARQMAREIAERDALEITDEQLESAAVLYAFRSSLNGQDWSASERLAALAMEKSREDPSHGVMHCKWVERLLASGRKEAADHETLRYLSDLAGRDPNSLATQNRILFWAQLLKTAREDLPKSVQFYTASFPEDSLDRPLPTMRMTPEPRLRGADS